MISEQIGQAIFLKVISLTVIPAPHEPQVTFLSGAGIAGNGRGGNLPDVGSGNGGNLPNSGSGNSPGAGGIGNGGKSTEESEVDSWKSHRISPSLLYPLSSSFCALTS